MVESVQMYLDYCNGLHGQKSWAEKRVDFSEWVPAGFGTSDYIKINQLAEKDGSTAYQIHTVDLKYGKGVRVDAEKNSQAMLYALGVLHDYGFIYDFKDTDIVNCVIVQPRLDHISEFKISVGELLKWAEEVVRPAAAKCLEESPEFHPGEVQCRFCRARASCSALASYSLKTAMEDFSVIEDAAEQDELVLKDVHKLTPKEVGGLLNKVDALESWVKALRGYALGELQSGVEIPGWKMVQGRAGSRFWIDQDKTIERLKKDGFKKKDYIEEKFVSPATVDKLLKKKKLDPEPYKALCSQKEGSPSLAKETDKRPEIPTAVETDFAVI